jgi:uncharacterized membrane protein YfcA
VSRASTLCLSMWTKPPVPRRRNSTSCVSGVRRCVPIRDFGPSFSNGYVLFRYGSYLPEMAGLLAGGVVSAFCGAQLVNRLSDRRLILLIAILLGALGLLLMTEAVLPIQSGDLLPTGTAAHLGAGVVIGIGIGLVSSVLGVAGGELLIPALVLIFGADIKTAGSASTNQY